jgi:hypothetical protein
MQNLQDHQHNPSHGYGKYFVQNVYRFVVFNKRLLI